MEQEKNLQPFNMAYLRKLRNIRQESLCKFGWGYTQDPYDTFFFELGMILSITPRPCQPWIRYNKDNVIQGDAWHQRIGEFHYKHKVHRFEFLYAESNGCVIAEHGPHEEPANRGTQIRKIKELYFFPDGTVKVCNKDEKHSLYNHFDHPIYVLSVKICNGGDR